MSDNAAPKFHDANCFIGLPTHRIESPLADGDALLREMDRVGIDRALVWHVAQRDYAAPVGNELLTQAIAGHGDRLSGCWSILPPQTGEMPTGDGLFAEMAGANVRALRAWPKQHRYLLREEVFGELFEQMTARRVPLLLSVPDAVSWEGVYDLLASVPELTVVLCDVGVWGQDRLFRPLMQRYPNVYLELSKYYQDGGIASFVSAFGHGRLLYGSGMPLRDYSMMFAVRHAAGEQAAAAIAGGNLAGLLEGVRI